MQNKKHTGRYIQTLDKDEGEGQDYLYTLDNQGSGDKTRQESIGVDNQDKHGEEKILKPHARKIKKEHKKMYTIDTGITGKQNTKPRSMTDPRDHNTSTRAQ